MFLDTNLVAPTPGPRIDFWTPLNKMPEPVLILSTRIWAHFIHYDRRTLPCSLETDAKGEILRSCEYCSSGELPRRWKGYLHVFRQHSATSMFLCLPEGAGNYLQSTYKMDFVYRGLRAYVSRVGGAKNKPLVISIDQHAERQKQLPEELDPGPYLETVFRLRGSLTPRQ